MHSGRFVRSFDNRRTDKSNLEYGTWMGMSTWMGKDAGDSSPLFNQKVGVGINVPFEWTGVIPDRIVLGIEGAGVNIGLCRG